MQNTILIIDDKYRLCKSLAWNFENAGYRTFIATNSEQAIAVLSVELIDVVLLDVMLGDESGVDLLERIRTMKPELPVIMITGYASIDSAVLSIKRGAYDYVRKPLDFDELLKTVENAKEASALKDENGRLRERLLQLSARVVTQNEAMIELCRKARRLAATDLPVLITGESGTGKEIIADFLHGISDRGSRPMIKVNCAAFPESLLDNELFGHEKGAYTGAGSRFAGVFETAHESSLFLDEVADMPQSIQAKILRVLQNYEIRRLGGRETIRVDVRFIAATNKDIDTLLGEGAFREDLYYRLNTAVVEIPPLRERREDIPLLADHFLSAYTEAAGLPAKEISQSLLNRLQAYDWPGNVRELKNTIHYAAAMSSGTRIEIEDLPVSFLQADRNPTSLGVRENVERDLIIRTLHNTRYNRSRTAEILNMTRKTLYNKMQRYGITT